MLSSLVMTHMLLALLLLAAPAKTAPAKAKAAPTPAEDDRDAPSIIHMPIKQAAAGQELHFEAEILDASGVFEPVVSWRPAGTSAWKNVPLNLVGKDQYRAALASVDVTANIEYFIEAYDAMGNGPARVGTPSQPMVVQVGSGAPGAAGAAPPTPVVVSTAPAVEAAGAPFPLGPVATIGAGAALAAVGAVLWFGASGDATALRNKVGQGGALRPEDREQATSIQTKGQIGSALMVVGLLAGGGGTAWLLIRPAPAAATLGVNFGF